MRMAQIAPIHEAVPPGLYGATERAMWSLTAELVASGHDVTLCSSGDPRTGGTLSAARHVAEDHVGLDRGRVTVPPTIRLRRCRALPPRPARAVGEDMAARLLAGAAAGLHDAAWPAGGMAGLGVARWGDVATDAPAHGHLARRPA